MQRGVGQKTTGAGGSKAPVIAQNLVIPPNTTRWSVGSPDFTLRLARVVYSLFTSCQRNHCVANARFGPIWGQQNDQPPLPDLVLSRTESDNEETGQKLHGLTSCEAVDQKQPEACRGFVELLRTTPKGDK